jgi:aminoglycoside phosphotransferase (APT) family kinase protein
MTTTAELQRVGQGREAQIFAWGEGKVLKLYYDAAQRRSLEIEAAAMSAAKAAGAPAPAAVETIELEGRPGLVMERCDGPDLLTQFGRKPWSVFAAGRTMGIAHARLHAVTAPVVLPRVKEAVPQRLARSDRVPEELRSVALRALEAMPDGDRLCHGDFHPGNIILTSHGPRVIDWPNAFSGDPNADIARTLLTFRLGEPPAGTAAIVRVLAVIGRRIMIGRYRTGYRSVRAFDDAAVDAWMLPVAIHRLTDGIDEERPRLLKYITRLMKRGRP